MGRLFYKSHAKLGRYLKKKREKAELTQLTVARLLGYSSAQFISNWERGLASPPLETLAVLAELYKIPKNELIEVILEDTRGALEQNFKGLIVNR